MCANATFLNGIRKLISFPNAPKYLFHYIFLLIMSSLFIQSITFGRSQTTSIKRICPLNKWRKCPIWKSFWTRNWLSRATWSTWQINTYLDNDVSSGIICFFESSRCDVIINAYCMKSSKLRYRTELYIRRHV